MRTVILSRDDDGFLSVRYLNGNAFSRFKIPSLDMIQDMLLGSDLIKVKKTRRTIKLIPSDSWEQLSFRLFRLL